MRIILSLTALTLLALAGPTEAATIYNSLSPNQMLKILDAESGTAEIDNSEGDTSINGRVESTNYSIYFYECDGNDFADPAKPDSKCLGFEYRAYFDGDEYQNDLEMVNQWNNDFHYGNLWRDEDGDLGLQLNVVVEDGITDDNIRITFAWWRAVLEGFNNFVKTK